MKPIVSHAPSPWRASGLMLLDARDQHVATFRERNGDEAGSLVLAAAAPDLRDALQDILQHVAPTGGERGPAVARAEAALKKARGGV